LRFIASSRPSGETDYWLKYSEGPAYNAWSGYAFESVCFAHIWQIKEKLSINGVIAPICSWTNDAGGSKDKVFASGNKKAQVDLIIDRNDGIVNLCEIKFANGDYAIDAAIDVELRNRKNAFIATTRTRKAVHITLITTYGVVRNAYWDTIQSEVTMNDLFR
jgi:hypothetical protein